jgi:hypothetical protein
LSNLVIYKRNRTAEMKKVGLYLFYSESLKEKGYKLLLKQPKGILVRENFKY